MNTTSLTVGCGAVTIKNKPVGLPAGSEIQMPLVALKAELMTGAPYLKLMVRCPGARSPAPYMVDASDLWLAVG